MAALMYLLRILYAHRILTHSLTAALYITKRECISCMARMGKKRCDEHERKPEYACYSIYGIVLKQCRLNLHREIAI